MLLPFQLLNFLHRYFKVILHNPFLKSKFHYLSTNNLFRSSNFSRILPIYLEARKQRLPIGILLLIKNVVGIISISGCTLMYGTQYNFEFIFKKDMLVFCPLLKNSDLIKFNLGKSFSIRLGLNSLSMVS